MSCKLKCPRCGLILKEKGDHSKEAQGEYVVHKDVWQNDVECLACKWMDKAATFDRE